MRRWNFASYDDYLSHQIRRARRTRHVTHRYGALRHRLIELLRQFAPDVQSILALGARNPCEVEDLLSAGFEAEGLDLFESRLIRRCDMSDLDGSAYFKDRRYDAFFFVHSLEHCLNFEQFRRRSLGHCRSIVAVAIPQRADVSATAWDCVAFDLQNPKAPVSAFERAFDGFELLHRELRQDTLLFLMRRKLELSPKTRSTRISPLYNLLVANRLASTRNKWADLERMLSAQIENSLEVGWRTEELVLITNFSFRHAGVNAEVIDLNGHCPRGSKMFAVENFLRRGLSDQAIVWAHDLDCWQNSWFEPPDFADVGLCEYSQPKFNGGSVFWRPRARDIVAEIVRRITDERADREEPLMNSVLRARHIAKRVTVLNPTYNVGCSAFQVRWERSIKPIRVAHFHPTNRLAWATHVLNRHDLPERSASQRLEKLLRRWWPELPLTFPGVPTSRGTGTDRNRIGEV